MVCTRHLRPAAYRTHSVFPLVEVTVALNSFFFCIVGLTGLFPAAFDGEQTASGRAFAMEVIRALAGDINSPMVTSGSDPTCAKRYGIHLLTRTMF